jgi:hypothetical protein
MASPKRLRPGNTAVYGHHLESPTIWPLLADRADGAALLAEALAAGHPSNAFREYVRLFERAFRAPPARLSSLLVATLDDRLDYSDEEVSEWMELRLA